MDGYSMKYYFATKNEGKAVIERIEKNYYCNM